MATTISPNISDFDAHKHHPRSVKTTCNQYNLVILDSNLNDVQSLAEGVIEGAVVHILRRDRDGIEQISEILHQLPKGHFQDLNVHLISHGSPGALQLGNSHLNLDTLDRYAWDLQAWFSTSPCFSRPIAVSLLIYGCSVAAGQSGQEFIQKLQQLVGVNIAASITPTGASTLGGNWNFEVMIGSLDPQTALQPQILNTYSHILVNAPPVVVNNVEATLDEGATFTLTSDYLLVTDSDTPDTAITYKFDVPHYGTILKNGVALNDGDSFTQDDINNSRISYQHNGSEQASDHVHTDVSDGTTTLYNVEIHFDIDLNVDDPPVIVNNLEAVVDEGGSFTVTADYLNTSDVDTPASAIVYTTSIPHYGTLFKNDVAMAKGDTFTQEDINNGRIRYQHNGSDQVSDHLHLKISDGTTTLDSEIHFDIDLNVDDPPTLSGTPVKVVNQNFFYQFAPTGSDVDSSSLLYSILNKPGWASFNPTTGLLSGKPTNADVGITKNIVIQVSDGTTTKSLSPFDLTVKNVNDAPSVSTPVPHQFVSPGDPFSFTLSSDLFTDIDIGDSLTLRVQMADGSALPSWLSFDPTTATVSGNSPDRGALSLRVTATDQAGASAEQVFQLSIDQFATALNTGSNQPEPAKSMKGQTGNDVLLGSRLSDVIHGMGGRDRITDGKGNEHDRLFGGKGNDQLLAGKGNDFLSGDDQNDRLKGGKGNDQLLGGQGNDRLLGQSGQDILIGGAGSDRLTGGKHRDMFMFQHLDDAIDTITDFNPQQDLIDLRGIFQTNEFASQTSFSQFNQFVRLVQIGANTEVQLDADGNGSGTQFTALAVLQSVTSSLVTASNIVMS